MKPLFYELEKAFEIEFKISFPFLGKFKGILGMGVEEPQLLVVGRVGPKHDGTPSG